MHLISYFSNLPLLANWMRQRLIFLPKSLILIKKNSLFTERNVFTKVKLKNIGNFSQFKISSSCYNFSTLLFMINHSPCAALPFVSRCWHNSFRYTVLVFDEFWPKNISFLSINQWNMIQFRQPIPPIQGSIFIISKLYFQVRV